MCIKTIFLGNWSVLCRFLAFLALGKAVSEYPTFTLCVFVTANLVLSIKQKFLTILHKLW